MDDFPDDAGAYSSRDGADDGLAGAVTRAAALGSAPARGVWSLLRRSSGHDWEDEGLLDGTEGRAREQREALLEQLARGGVPLDELRRAVADDRLAVLPAERVLAGNDRYTCRELAGEVGMDTDVLRGDLMALGFAVPPVEAKAFDEHDLEAARAVAAFHAAGLDARELRNVGRVIGQTLRTVASAVRELIGNSELEPRAGEQELGVRYAQLAEALAPQLGTLVAQALRVHLRDGVRDDVIRASEREHGRLADTVPMTVAFADLAGFTALGVGDSPQRVAAVAERFAALAAAAARPPVRLVKLLGDGALLAARRPDALLQAALRLREAVGADSALPELRVGVASGEVTARHGDVHGTPVNLAARLCDLALPGRLAADESTRSVRPELAWRRVEDVELKGFEVPLTVYVLDRVREGSAAW